MYEGILVQNGGRDVDLSALPKTSDGELILEGVETLKINLIDGATYVDAKFEILENNNDIKVVFDDALGNEIVLILRGLNDLLLANADEVPVFEVFDGPEPLLSLRSIEDLEAAAAGGTTSDVSTADALAEDTLDLSTSSEDPLNPDGFGGTGDPVVVEPTIAEEPVNSVATVGASSGGVKEDDDEILSTNGVVSVTDPDEGEALIQPQTDVAGTYGTFSIDSDGIWLYEADNSQFAIQSLAEGQTLTETFTVTSLDGSASNVVTITITGTNDGPVLADVDVTGGVTEDAATPDLTDSGTIAFTDVDLIDTHTLSVTPNGTPIGTLTANIIENNDGDGVGEVEWNYSISNEAVQYLKDEETKVETFTVKIEDRSVDGDLIGTFSEKIITITITGSNDGPSLTVTSGDTGTVYEAGLSDGSGIGSTVITSTGTFTIADLDGLDDITHVKIGTTEVAIGDLVGTEIDTGHSTLKIDSYVSGVASFTYTLTDNVTDVANQAEQDIFTLSVSDDGGSTYSATDDITITIVDDVPTIDPENAIIQNVTGNVVGDVATLDLNMNYGADGAGSVILNPDKSTEVDTFGYAVDTLGNLLTSTVSGTVYNLVYVMEGDSIVAVQIGSTDTNDPAHPDNFEIDLITGYATYSGNDLNSIKVFTIAPDYTGSGDYTVTMNGILDGGALTFDNVISTQNVSTQGGNSDTRTFIIDNDGDPQTTEDILEVNAYGNFLLFDFPNNISNLTTIIVDGTSYSIGQEVTISLSFMYDGNTYSGDVTVVFASDGTYDLIDMDRFDWPVDVNGDYIHDIKAKPTVDIEYLESGDIVSTLLYDSSDLSDNDVYMEFGTTNYTNNNLGTGNTSINENDILTLEFSKGLKTGTTFTLSGNGSAEGAVVLYYQGVALDPTKYDTSYFDSATNKYHIIVEDNLLFDRVDFYQDGTTASGYSLTSMNAITSYESQGTPHAINIDAEITDADGDTDSSSFAVVFDNDGVINDNGTLILQNSDDDIDSWDMANILSGASSDTSLLDQDISSIDLLNGDHILSNIDVANVIAISDNSNILKITGDSGDSIDLDLGVQDDFGTVDQVNNKWYIDAGQNTATETAYVSTDGTDVVTLLIENDVNVI